MLYIISPTKTMKTDGIFTPTATPFFWQYAKDILQELQKCSACELMKLMHIKESMAILNQERFSQIQFDLQGHCAIESYDGLQFKYMQVKKRSEEELAYLQQHLRILSGFYGVVKPFDSIYPYRLEMQCKLAVNDKKDLYAYWQDHLAQALLKEISTHKDKHLLNLASKEYEKAIRPYFPREYWIDAIFQVEKNGKRKVEATQAKMARGTMIQFLATHHIETLEDVYKFQEDGYCLDKERTGKQQIVFYKKA